MSSICLEGATVVKTKWVDDVKVSWDVGGCYTTLYMGYEGVGNPS